MINTSQSFFVFLSALWSQFVLADADWVLRGGVIYSMDDTASHYSAMAVKGNRLTWLGKSEAAAAQIGPETQVIELEGRTVLPGFIGTHIHSMDTLPLMNGVSSVLTTPQSRCLRILQTMPARIPIRTRFLAQGFWRPLLG